MVESVVGTLCVANKSGVCVASVLCVVCWCVRVGVCVAGVCGVIACLLLHVYC